MQAFSSQVKFSQKSQNFAKSHPNFTSFSESKLHLCTKEKQLSSSSDAHLRHKHTEHLYWGIFFYNLCVALKSSDSARNVHKSASERFLEGTSFVPTCWGMCRTANSTSMSSCKSWKHLHNRIRHTQDITESSQHSQEAMFTLNVGHNTSCKQ